MRWCLALLASFSLAGCSLLFDGSRHMTGGGTADAGRDASQDGEQPQTQCTDHSECAGDPAGTQCIDGTCGCSDHDHCAAFCDLEEGSCAECLEDAHCPNEEPVCDGGSCTGCETGDDCDGDPSVPVCHPDTGACVQCVTDGDCPVGAECTTSSLCVPEGCDEDEDGFPADRPECFIEGTPFDCADDNPNRFPGNIPICGDSMVQGCPDAAMASALTELGAAEIGLLPLSSIAAEPADQLSVAIVPPGLGAGSPDAFVVWRQDAGTVVGFSGYHFDGTPYTTGRALETDGVCSGTLHLNTLAGRRLERQGNALYLTTSGSATTATGALAAYVALFRVDPQRDFIEGTGSERCRASLNAEAPTAATGLMNVGVPAGVGLMDLDLGAGAFRTAEILNTSVNSVAIGAGGTIGWMEASGRFVFGISTDTTVRGGAVGHTGDGNVEITLGAEVAGRAALTSIETAGGPRNYFLAIPDVAGAIHASRWSCASGSASCFDATQVAIGTHDQAPFLDASALNETHVALVMARDRAGIGDARNVVLSIVPFDPARGAGVEGIPILTTREHGIAAPSIADLAIDSHRDGDGNTTLVLAATVADPSGGYQVTVNGVRICAAP